MEPRGKVAFFHDHVFCVNSSGNVFSSGGLPASAWCRYLRHFNTLTVVARCRSGIIDEKEESQLVLSSKNGVEFEFCPSASNVKSLLLRGGEARRVVKSVVEQNDFVIARLTSELGLIAINEAEKQKKPWAIELVDCPWDSYWNYGGIRSKLYSPLIYKRVKSVVSRSDFVLYVTEKFLQDRYPCKSGFTMDCSNVELDDFSEDVLIKRLDRIKSLDDGRKLVVGQIASLSGRFKGIQVSMRAISRLREVYPNIEFRVLGGGDSKTWEDEAHELGIDDICYFDGTLPSGDPVFSWLDNVDLYIHPSFKEGLPRALIEAMGRGCPSIGSNIAGIPELLSSDMMIPPGDDKKLSALMIDVLRSKERMEKLAENNFVFSKKYVAHTLDKKRDFFWNRFSLVTNFIE